MSQPTPIPSRISATLSWHTSIIDYSLALSHPEVSSASMIYCTQLHDMHFKSHAHSTFHKLELLGSSAPNRHPLLIMQFCLVLCSYLITVLLPTFSLHINVSCLNSVQNSVHSPVQSISPVQSPHCKKEGAPAAPLGVLPCMFKIAPLGCY